MATMPPGEHKRGDKQVPAVLKGRLRGSTQEKDVAEQHEVSARPVEGHGRTAGGLPAVPGAQAAAHGVPDLRDIQPASGDFALLRPCRHG